MQLSYSHGCHQINHTLCGLVWFVYLFVSFACLLGCWPNRSIHKKRIYIYSISIATLRFLSICPSWPLSCVWMPCCMPFYRATQRLAEAAIRRALQRAVPGAVACIIIRSSSSSSNNRHPHRCYCRRPHRQHLWRASVRWAAHRCHRVAEITERHWSHRRWASIGFGRTFTQRRIRYRRVVYNGMKVDKTKRGTEQNIRAAELQSED